MIYGLYLSTAGAKAQSYRQDVIANNVANVDTAGFRRQFVSARQRLDRLGEQGQGAPSGVADPRRLGGAVELFRTCNDLTTTGTIKPSGSPSHMAIAGEGFFRVRRGNEIFLTRDGAFAFGPDGVLRTNDGVGEVLSQDGEPIKMDPNEPFDVSASNMITQYGRNVAKLGVFFPSNPKSLERVGESMFRYDGRHDPGHGQIKQYFLEGSNVDPIREMTDLIEAARGFELNIQMVQLQNDSLGRLVDQVPRVS